MSRAAARKAAAILLALAAVVALCPADPLDAQERSGAAGPPGGFAWTVAAPPGRPAEGHVFAGVTGGVLRSLDGGDSWQEAAATSFVPALAVSPDFEHDRTLFAGTSGEGILRSTDGGESWESAGEGLTDPNIEVVTFSPAYEADRTVFAGTFGGGVFRSTDGGYTWRAASRGLTNDSVLTLATSPRFRQDGTIFAGLRGGGVFESFGGGKYTFPDGGIFRSTDRGESWQQVNAAVGKGHGPSLGPVAGLRLG